MSRSNWSYFRIGAELDAVKSFIGDDVVYGAAQASMSQVAVSSWGGNLNVPIDPKQNLIAQLALGIVTRGWPTLASTRVEQSVLAFCEATTGLQFAQRTSTSDFRWNLISHLDEGNGIDRTLASGLFPIDSRLTLRDDLAFGSETEYRIFKHVLEPAFGPAIGWVELQRPLATIIDDDAAQGSLSSVERVDFAFELEADGSDPMRLIVEVDGPQHLQAVQFHTDRSRDDLSRKAGWPTVRVRVSDPACAKRDAEGLRHTIEQLIKGSPFLTSLRNTSALDEDAPLPAVLLTRWPHAIQRTQLALLNALINGRLRFDQETWDIGVIERDARCAGLAIADLLAWLRHLGSLYGTPHLPAVRVTTYNATGVNIDPVEAGVPEREPFSLDVFHRTEPDDSHSQHDLLVDVAVRAFPLHRYRDDPYERLIQQSHAGTIVRTAPRSTGAESIKWPPAIAVQNVEEKNESLRFVLQQVFRKKDFREGQLAIIHRALNRQSTIGLLPTGAGKSLTFQLPALISPGMTIVIDPIKSLMQDQVDNLRAIGIHTAAVINSDRVAKERDRDARLMGNGDRRFVFIAPERLQIETFRNEMRRACSRFPTAYFVIDEAHCVSEWGHDFRTAYLRIGQLARELCRHAGQEPPILALTATASTSVLTDVQREIGIGEPSSIVSPATFDRPELSFHIVRSSKKEKERALASLLSHMEDHLLERLEPGQGQSNAPTALGDANVGVIVFCPHVNGSIGVSAVRDFISSNVPALPDRVEFYSGEMPKNFQPPNSAATSYSSDFHQRRALANDWARYKADVQRRFKRNQVPLLVATSAFGMGIDKPNIRYTIHFAMTKTIEDFAQQAGRAGRDGQPALCSIIFSDDAHTPPNDPLASGISSREAIDRMRRSHGEAGGDTGIVMFLHSLGYLGIEEEIADICAFYHQSIEPRMSGQLGLDGAQQIVVSKRDFPFAGIHGLTRSTNVRQQTSEDRILYRLSLLGIIDDYTVQYSASGNVYSLTVHAVSEADIRSNLAVYVQRYKLADGVQQVFKVMNASRRPHAVDRAVEALTTFVYEEIEKKRREGMANMRQLLRDSKTGEELRDGIRNFLDHNSYTDRVFKILSYRDDSAWWPIIDSVTSEDLAAQLLGQCQRGLEADPDHAGVRILAGLARAMRANRDLREIVDDLDAGLNRWFSVVDSDRQRAIDVARKIAWRLQAISPDLLESITELMVLERHNTIFARGAYRYIGNPDVALICASPILDSIQQTVAAIRTYHLELRT
jgi:ATP-dependent DNA helicase RecQ